MAKAVGKQKIPSTYGHRATSRLYRDLTNEKPPCGKKLLRADSQPRQGLLHVRSYHDTVFAVP